jgi:hypothetical protein
MAINFPWPEGEKKVFDRLGGRDMLRLVMNARGFHTYRYKVKSERFVIEVRCATFIYDEQDKKRRLMVTESYLTPGSTSPCVVIIEIRPVAPSLEWLRWVVDRDGDWNLDKHRTWFDVTNLDRLDEDKLVRAVEKVTRRDVKIF